ncbi:MAG: GNAT family N-acetyltransferase [Planctomycetaceae bacterium]|nr:GNAT family N-acetyltransferase [Planctomycetaceae bacterium]
MIPIETSRLLMRPLSVADAEPLAAVFSDPEVMRWSDGLLDAAGIRDWLGKRIAGDPLRPWIGPWAVVQKSTSNVIGYCGFFYFPDIIGLPETEIGFRLVRACWGQGLATEAARAALARGFDLYNLERVIALIAPENVASIRVAEKLGMQYEQDVMLEGYTYPDRVYVINRSNHLC